MRAPLRDSAVRTSRMWPLPAISVVLGTTLAYLQARTDVPFKRLIFAVSLVPLIIPGMPDSR